jgi:hypothetical protein
MGALPAMIKYGVSTPTACYAASIGINDRPAAMNLADHCPYPEPTFGAFLDWISQLSAADVTAITTPEIARLLLRSAGHRSPRAAQATILAGHGTFTCHLRGVNAARSIDRLAQLPAGTLLTLERERDNAADSNAIRVEHDGRTLGWVAREVARPLAIALDDTPEPTVIVRLATAPWRLAQEAGVVDQLAAHDTIQLTVTLISR